MERMLDALAHRGPDAGNLVNLGAGAPTLGHRRLAIVDISEAGRQPMRSACGRYTLVLNGEIYNHARLRNDIERECDGQREWRGHSDTETLLAAVVLWGLRTAIERCTGMFAVALWDSEQRTLTLARDRFGEKPLYWMQSSRGFAFASELKALIKAGWVDGRVSRDAVALLLKLNHIPAPKTIFDGVHKLPPATLLTLAHPSEEPRTETYWSIAQTWRDGLARPFAGDDVAATDQLEGQLTRVLSDQMSADVPLGAFLSGGIDSSVIVALMQRQSAKKVRTFSIGLHDQGYNEAEAAAAVAKHLGTEHTELYVTAADALAVVEALPSIYCEPFADSSQIPTFLVSQMARQHVTVALSGDAGDELFGGYNRYLFGPSIAHRTLAWPRFTRRAAAGLLNAIPPARWNSLAKSASSLLLASARFSDFGDKIQKLSRALSANDEDELYDGFISQWTQTEQAVPSSRIAKSTHDWNSEGLSSLSFSERMMISDACGYLPGDILAKVDRASMAVSLETRAPFLDHELYAFAASLPLHMKIRKGVTKWLVRQVLYRHVPQVLIDRPKAGFGVPIDQWLRGELRDWAENLLSEAALKESGVFEVGVIRKCWQTHLDGRANLQHPLWCVLMFQAWHAKWKKYLTLGESAP